MLNLSYKKIKENKSLTKHDSMKSMNQIKAKYKNKYYLCKILEKRATTSKVLFIASKYITTVNNKDIQYNY